jgi:hypothetical protein
MLKVTSKVMKTTKEKQITSYSRLVGICETIGARYNPSKEAIKPAALSALLEQAQQAMNAATVAQQAYNNAVSVRRASFVEIPKLATRVFHAMAAWNAPEETLEDVQKVRRTFEYHARSSAKKLREQNAEVPKGNPAVQLNYEAKASNFEKLVEIVKTVPGYAPNEADLTIEALTAFHATLIGLNKHVISMQTAMLQARFKRNALLFGKEGIHGTAKTVKHYLRTAFDSNSDEFKMLNGIRFTKK